jgi:hypothetical protein
MHKTRLLALLVIVSSCGHPDKTASNVDSTSHPDTGKTVTAAQVAAVQKPAAQDSSAKVSPDSMMIASVGKDSIADWKEFWPKMKQALANKDTAAVMRGTYFPFFTSYGLDDVNTFKEVIIDQLFDINLKKAKQPVSMGKFDLSLNYRSDSSIYPGLLLDTVYYWYFPHQQIYFGKVKGSYKLLGMETPG